jgi:hypothetical protein
MKTPQTEAVEMAFKALRGLTVGEAYQKAIKLAYKLERERGELCAALVSALPYIEEGEGFEKPNGRKLSTTVRALIRAVDPEAGA